MTAKAHFDTEDISEKTIKQGWELNKTIIVVNVRTFILVVIIIRLAILLYSSRGFFMCNTRLARQLLYSHKSIQAAVQYIYGHLLCACMPKPGPRVSLWNWTLIFGMTHGVANHFGLEKC